MCIFLSNEQIYKNEADFPLQIPHSKRKLLTKKAFLSRFQANKFTKSATKDLERTVRDSLVTLFLLYIKSFATVLSAKGYHSHQG